MSSLEGLLSVDKSPDFVHEDLVNLLVPVNIGARAVALHAWLL